MNRSKIEIRAANPKDFQLDELNELRAELQNCLPGFALAEINSKNCTRGTRDLGWWEIIFILLPTLGADVRSYVVTKILDAVSGWAKRRFNDVPENTKPKCIVVYDVERIECGSAVLFGSDDDPVTREEAIAISAQRNPGPPLKDAAKIKGSQRTPMKQTVSKRGHQKARKNRAKKKT